MVSAKWSESAFPVNFQVLVFRGIWEHLSVFVGCLKSGLKVLFPMNFGGCTKRDLKAPFPMNFGCF